MLRRQAAPTVPRPCAETLRRSVADILRRERLSAREISAAVRIAEKEVYPHLEHIRRSAAASREVLEVTPAQCRRCGFTFTHRERLTPPGKCPVCRHESIQEPLFALRPRS